MKVSKSQINGKFLRLVHKHNIANSSYISLVVDTTRLELITEVSTAKLENLFLEFLATLPSITSLPEDVILDLNVLELEDGTCYYMSAGAITLNYYSFGDVDLLTGVHPLKCYVIEEDRSVIVHIRYSFEYDGSPIYKTNRV